MQAAIGTDVMRGDKGKRKADTSVRAVLYFPLLLASPRVALGKGNWSVGPIGLVKAPLSMQTCCTRERLGFDGSAVTTLTHWDQNVAVRRPSPQLTTGVRKVRFYLAGYLLEPGEYAESSRL